MTVLADSAPYVDWSSMFKILLISIGAGAGLVTVYSVGLLAISASGYLRGADEEGAPHRRNLLALVAAVVCLAIVAGAAIYGIHVMLVKG